jgi:predicted SPOUT superfamily RNA methylase MTH1
VFNDGQTQPQQRHSRDFAHDDGYTGDSDPDNFLYHVLSYLECPPHFRRKLFAMHPNTSKAGTLPSLDMPHHSSRDRWMQYREGVTMDEEALQRMGGETPSKKQKKEKLNSNGASETESTAVDVGYPVPVMIPVVIPSNTRVTVKFPSAQPPSNFPFPKFPTGAETLTAEAVNPVEPREEGGYYWGYTIRQAPSLSAIFTECEFENGYDVSIGTSERGIPLSSIIPGNASSNPSKQLPKTFNHALVVLGGVAGLEAAAAADQDLVGKGVGKGNVNELFDFWVNACPGQGSRTIRTEEATWVVLSQIHEWAQAVHQ